MHDEGPAAARAVGVDALKALAHPLRVRLFSALTSYGPATASALAARLRESSGLTSYHLRQLAKHGFVREDESRGNARDRWWERVAGPIEIDTTSLGSSDAARAAGDLVELEFVRLENDRYAEYWNARDSIDQEWARATQATSANLRLTPAELTEFGEQFDALIDRYRGRVAELDGRCRVDVQLRAFPVIDTLVTPDTVTGSIPTIEPDTPEGAPR